MEYAWLDVLCLRQEGKKDDEPTREEEWKLDVPTIGAVYRQARSVVYYYSGLGLPFQISDLTYHRHWFNRAWTLQETKDDNKSFVAGISAASPQMPWSGDTSDAPVDESVRAFCERMDTIQQTRTSTANIFEHIGQMILRSASYERDKIAGLLYVSSTAGGQFGLPTYMVKEEDPEDAWWRLVQALSPIARTFLLLFFPEPGDGTRNRPVWCPSWHQVNTCTLPTRDNGWFYVEHWRDAVSVGFRGQSSIVQYPHVKCSISGFAGRHKREGAITLQGTPAKKKDIEEGHLTFGRSRTTTNLSPMETIPSQRNRYTT